MKELIFMHLNTMNLYLSFILKIPELFFRLLGLCFFSIFIFPSSSVMALGLGDTTEATASGFAQPSSFSSLPSPSTSTQAWSSFYAPSPSTSDEVIYWTNSQGRIFAVQWKSQVMPDLQMILSSHFPAFIDAQKSKKTVMSQEFSIEQSDFRLISRGHLRAYRGFAYQPSLVPTGFSLNSLSSFDSLAR